MTKEDPFAHLKLFDFEHWGLYLHGNQYPYIGRCYAWANREDADLVTDMTFDERNELYGEIIPLWWDAVQELFGSIRPNISCLGNEAPHLHYHLIPRYDQLVKFQGINFEDVNQGRNYAPYEKKSVGANVLFDIRDALKSKLLD